MRILSAIVISMSIWSQWTAVVADNLKSPLRQKLKHIADELEAVPHETAGENNAKKLEHHHHHHTGPSQLQGSVYANDDCYGAINLDSFIGRPYNDYTTLIYEIPPCMYQQQTSWPQLSGRWYSVTGTGNTMTASTCGYATFDTVIQVFSGYDCGSLTCEAQNDDDPNCSLGWERSTVTFPTIWGVTYYFLVYGHNGSGGSFEILVTETLPTPTRAPSNVNDRCETATVLTAGQTVFGTTGQSYVDYFDSCMDATQSTSGQAWYKVTATGSRSSVETCATQHATFDTQVSIFYGPACGLLNCVAGVDDNCGTQNKEALAEWNSGVGTTYYAVVHGYGPAYGDFTVKFESNPY